MHYIEPSFFTEKRAYAMGKTNLLGQTNRLLKTGYNTLFICQTGWAVVSLYNKNYLFRQGDILNANWDMRPVFSKVSADFLTFYCMMSEEFFYEVFAQVSGAFCDFTYTFPILTPTQEQATQLHAWRNQVLWVNGLAANNHRQTVVKNTMHSLFLMIDSELQMRAINTPLLALPRAMQILREFGNLLQKHAKNHHAVSFYADKLCITPYYLSTITAEVMQDSPKGLIDKQIIMEMKTILKTSNTPLKILAEEMNFEDTSYMSRFFRRHTGLSPSEYRNKNSN